MGGIKIGSMILTWQDNSDNKVIIHHRIYEIFFSYFKFLQCRMISITSSVFDSKPKRRNSNER